MKSYTQLRSHASKAIILSCGFLSHDICTGQEPAVTSATEVVLASEIEWQQLNPARGDQSPKAATLWGDRNGHEKTGFLVKFVDGFKSPPHIHNVTYRGLVIDGLVHNDDPAAAPMWMPAGSFWTQPAGEVHITAAKGDGTMAYIEIESGPYLVKPTEEAFDNGERPLNIDHSNIVWLDATNTSWIDAANPTAPKLSFLWGEPEGLNGTAVRLPAGFAGIIDSKDAHIRVVVIKGQLNFDVLDESAVKQMSPGSYFSSSPKTKQYISNTSAIDCLLYIRSEGAFKVSPRS